jgi:hypothetical protein
VRIRRVAAIVFSAVSMGVIAFQLALALGVPWGSYAMGGAFPGQFPLAMRAAALVQASLLLLTVLVVLARQGIALPSWSRASRWLVWIVVALGFVSLVMNLATPSVGERMIWAPVALVLVACSTLVATGKTQTDTSSAEQTTHDGP